ncbi:MAG: hypothetical protein CVT95_09960 [Bacteroidetes bacterium HGW-Bacteroidetes-12]|nr:MAG: hypothetical protein CVT95_09960 [Bacteroidetes bacterium HGW-Bacteroidetes-12]
MQLKKLLLSTAILILGGNLIAQETNNKQSYLDTTKAKIGQVEVDILSSYYDQDGIHSPVTGGRGTEDLQDLTNTLIISIPYGKNTFSINLGQDNITSASTDNMDTDVSSDSKVDSRNHGDITITHKLNKRKSYHVGAGFSSEYDVTSFNVGGGFSIESKDRNTSLDFNTKVYYDNWLLYQPAEFRPGVDSFVLENFNHQIYDSPNGEDTRTSYNFSLTIARVVNKKLQVSITGDFVYQTGLLNTPFHRVYFDDGFDASGLDELSTIKSKKVRKREFLPDSRIKIPVALRLHYYINSTFIVRGFYRYYYDDRGS